MARTAPDLTEFNASAKQRRETLGRLADLLERQGIDIADIGSVRRISMWQGLTKSPDGDAELHDLVGVQFAPSWDTGPQWPVIQPGPAVRLPARRTTVPQPAQFQRAVVLPDMQIGYFRRSDEGLEPTHDEAALTVALELVRRARPQLVVLVGDNLDAPEFGKYRLSPAYQRTTQAAIDRATVLMAQLRDAAPDADIIWLAGNHEERLPHHILDNARAAYGLRQGNTPASWPVMSVPHLCRLDDYRIEYRPGYPASSVWVNERLRVVHGSLVRSNGSTATAYLGREKTSVIYGHVHRIEWAERTREDHDGPRTILAASPGTLARIDGAVPSTKGGVDLDGRPVVRHEDWQQGVAVVDYEPGDGRFHLELVPIRDGWARWHGRDIHAA